MTALAEECAFMVIFPTVGYVSKVTVGEHPQSGNVKPPD